MEYFSAAKAAAYKIFEIIDRVPEIDSMSPEGFKPEHVKGEITFRNVEFTYPSRTDVQVCRKRNSKQLQKQLKVSCSKIIDDINEIILVF